MLLQAHSIVTCTMHTAFPNEQALASAPNFRYCLQRAPAYLDTTQACAQVCSKSQAQTVFLGAAMGSQTDALDSGVTLPSSDLPVLRPISSSIVGVPSLCGVSRPVECRCRRTAQASCLAQAQ